MREAVAVKGAAEHKYLRDIRKKISSFASMVRGYYYDKPRRGSRGVGGVREGSLTLFCTFTSVG